MLRVNAVHVKESATPQEGTVSEPKAPNFFGEIFIKYHTPTGEPTHSR